jgi:heme-degrading monooxygenase HmoA
MILEIAQIDVKTGMESQFEAGVAKASPLFQRAKSCHGLELQRSFEKRNRYRLVIKWDTVDDHNRFRDSEDFQEWRKLVGSYFESTPLVEHTETVFRGF